MKFYVKTIDIDSFIEYAKKNPSMAMKLVSTYASQFRSAIASGKIDEILHAFDRLFEVLQSGVPYETAKAIIALLARVPRFGTFFNQVYKFMNSVESGEGEKYFMKYGADLLLTALAAPRMFLTLSPYVLEAIRRDRDIGDKEKTFRKYLNVLAQSIVVDILDELKEKNPALAEKYLEKLRPVHLKILEKVARALLPIAFTLVIPPSKDTTIYREIANEVKSMGGELSELATKLEKVLDMIEMGSKAVIDIPKLIEVLRR